MKDLTTSQIPPFGVRMPNDLKKWLAEEAHRNDRSMNAELLRILKEERERRHDKQAA